MATTWLKKRQTKYSAYVAVYILLALAILSAANYLANRYNKTFDATGNKVFSLSDQTRKILGNLKTDVRILYFDQSNRFSDSRFVVRRGNDKVRRGRAGGSAGGTAGRPAAGSG